MDKTVVIPRPLVEGDEIAIVSPASIIDPAYVSGAVEVIERLGWKPVVARSALNSHGSFSGTAKERLEDLNNALRNPRIRAILCSRGGYGAVHLLEGIDRLAFLDDPKWIVGFSDISALHAYAAACGVASVHASMCKHLALFGENDECSSALVGILRGTAPEYHVDPHPYNRCGKASGRLAGGNLAVISALISTPYDPFAGTGDILVIEDIAEPIYKVERIMWQLRYAGVFNRISGMIVGQFTEYRPDRNYTAMEDMLRDLLRPYSFPVAFNFPVGHVDRNLPLLMSVNANLEVSSAGVSLSY